jgi:hypothetical protein
LVAANQTKTTTMKNLLLILLLTCFFETSFAQELASDSSKIISKETLLLKKKNQKRAANILLISGGSLMVISGIVAIGEATIFVASWGSNEENLFKTSSALFTVGLVASVASIPFYIAAGKNKRKAAALSLQQQKIPYLQNNTVASSMIPAVSLKIRL